MEQLSIRDWMVILGGMMIAAVLIDAVRRYWRERRAEIRLNARIDRSRPLSEDDDAFNLLTELPNGGARIIRRDDLTGMAMPDEGALPSVSASRDSAPTNDELIAESPVVAESVEGVSAPAPMDPIDRAVEEAEGQSLSEVDSPMTASSESEPPPEVVEPGLGAVSTPDQEKAVRRRTVKSAAGSAEGVDAAQPLEAGTVDWLDNLDDDDDEDPGHGRLPRGANTHVFILYVVARSEEGFSGTGILETLLACDLRFGDMDFFHRHERPSGRGAIEFSVANMMKPGVFDIDNMEPLQTRGLMFFVTLPGPADMLKAFDYMYETAKVVAKMLGGDIQDETRSVVTRQSLEHMRQQIRELERRLLVRRN